MVLENLIEYENLKAKPRYLFLLGFFYVIFSGILSYFIFPKYSSIVMVTFTIILSLPLMRRLLDEEEHKEITGAEWYSHTFAVKFFLYLFLGFTLGFVFLYVGHLDSVLLFEAQTSTIEEINSITGYFISDGQLSTILSNNLTILVVCILLSFFYGAGALFVLTWNASVMGVAIGMVIVLSQNMVKGLFNGLLRYLIHGIPELIAFFIAALASSILSYAVANHHLSKENYHKVLNDTIYLLAISVIILVLAAFIEVYLTPLLI